MNERTGVFFGSCILTFAGVIFGAIGHAKADPTDTEAFSVNPAVMTQIKPRTGEKLSQAALVERGRKIFETETFSGNGRTCATCHPVANNFTLDPKFIAKLQPDDPLFVAEYNPVLAKLENPTMLRHYGLITENVDGMAEPGVLRSVPHVLGLGLSTTPAPRFSLTEMTGWSGDGAPGDGSLRQFAIGAVSQHLTKSLAREPGKDFRVPSDDELDALLAYQLSLGQQVLLNVEPGEEDELMFRDPAVEHGKNLFDTPARKGLNSSCFSCHYKAGANDEALDAGGHGNNFATGTNTLRNPPDCGLPADGGFGKAQLTPVAASAACGTRSTASRLGRGNGKFNVPSLVAAAETPPFFHNNSAATLEEAISFYTTDTFKNSPAGHGQAFRLGPTAIAHIAAFLRGVNAYENVIEAMAEIDPVTGQPAAIYQPASERALLKIDSAIRVMQEQKPTPLFAATHAVDALYDARAKLSHADATQLASAKVDLGRALSLMAK